MQFVVTFKLESDHIIYVNFLHKLNNHQIYVAGHHETSLNYILKICSYLHFQNLECFPEIVI